MASFISQLPVACAAQLLEDPGRSAAWVVHMLSRHERHLARLFSDAVAKCRLLKGKLLTGGAGALTDQERDLLLQLSELQIPFPSHLQPAQAAQPQAVNPGRRGPAEHAGQQQRAPGASLLASLPSQDARDAAQQAEEPADGEAEEEDGCDVLSVEAVLRG